MNPDQAIATLRTLLNIPAIKLLLPTQDIATAEKALQTRAEATKPKPESSL